MISFDIELRALAAGLDLPEPVRSRVLLELRSDLEDMAAALREGGVGEADARWRALEALLPSGETVGELGRVHRPLYRRLVDRFSDRRRHRLERGLLAVLVAVQLGVGVVTLSRFDLLESPSPFLVPALLVGALIAAVGVAKLFQLFVAGAHGRERLRRGLGVLAALGAVALAVGFGGLVVDFYAVAGRLASGSERQAAELAGWLRRDAALLSVALLEAWLAGLVWLVASVRLAGIEQTEAAALGISTLEGRNA